ncbi:MAG: thiamine diphosphokinase [Ruminococcaceae bacterium]|nr:thiamine diphosphokinase [Oscillospiraceae bacterium]
MKKCVIFAAAPIYDLSFIKVEPDSFVICADAGVRYANALSATPDLVLGDFDSCDREESRKFATVTFPSRKDDTDLMLAVKYGIESDCDDFTIYGALGARLDHTYAAFSALGYLLDNGKTARLCDERHTVSLLPVGEHRVKNTGGYLSLFPYGCDCARVSLKGTSYDGQALLTASFPLGVSNEIVEDEAVITVHGAEAKTRVLMIVSQKD